MFKSNKIYSFFIVIFLQLCKYFKLDISWSFKLLIRLTILVCGRQTFFTYMWIDPCAQLFTRQIVYSLRNFQGRKYYSYNIKSKIMPTISLLFIPTLTPFHRKHSQYMTADPPQHFKLHLVFRKNIALFAMAASDDPQSSTLEKKRYRTGRL